MPHQCVSCGTFFEDGAHEILSGCSNCGHKLFFYVKKERLEEFKKDEPQLFKLSDEDKKQVEDDIYDIIGVDADRSKTVILDIESVKILKPGKYELDLVNLFKKKQPLIYKLEDGKYMIDVIESFKKMR